MIERTVKLRTQVEHNQGEKEPQKRLPTTDLLQPSDWHLLSLVLAILKPFKKLTKWFEGHSASFSEVIATQEWLIDLLEDQVRTLHPNLEAPTEFTGGPFHTQPEITVASQQAQLITLDDNGDDNAEPLIAAAASSQRPRRVRRLPARLTDSVIDLPRRLPTGQLIPPAFELADDLPDPSPSLDLDDDHLFFVRSSVQLAIQKLQEYAGLMEESPAYWAAMLLQPRHRKMWVNTFLSPNRAQKAYGACRELYRAGYADLPVPHPLPQPPVPLSRGSHLRSHTYYDPLEDLSRKYELAEYFAERVWQVEGSPGALASIVKDDLGLVIYTSDRHRWGDNSINLIMCSKNWSAK
ncbi:hypothetical protein B0H63DRAFT_137000 [Podospora didyma]|uniref:AP2/ERF domain-containing protein n=1 Tax=Podospora didyma TaxID=330526 RepID=A0AAE0NRS7_9PEZI|nr:hypothetical protein B0H63DRAFT_137000 [Podospora didyma]